MNKLSLVTLASVAAMSLSTVAFAQEEEVHIIKMKGDHKMMEMMGGHRMMKMKGKKHHMMYLLMDTDEDGSVTAKEFNDFRAENFSKADKNGDGNLNAEEFSELRKIKKELHKKAMKMAKKKKAQKHFGKLDADGDGKISKAEFDAKGERSFIRMDHNDDGVLNKKDRRKKMHVIKKMKTIED
ncbi:MAG: EF-hand domain-containing protein [Emcibacter sp.]|nr:EF-hand domain-containing protein [Emcibacter sp.]